jgi:hypothetical protein
MGGKVWYILAQEGSELPEDAESVMCGNDDTISDLKQEVWKMNPNTLIGVDARRLEVFEHGETETRCQGQTNLNECTSGSKKKPFTIFYPGIPVESCLLKNLIHRTLHATSIFLWGVHFAERAPSLLR